MAQIKWVVSMLFLAIFLAMSKVPAAQTVVNNPRGLAFTCPDHDGDDQHEIDIVRESDGRVVQTLLSGDPPLNAAGEVEVVINVQPVAFGRYYFIVRAVAGTLRSDNSDPSQVWQRVPGRPSGLIVR